MTKLTEKKRDEAKSLLEDHQKVTDALANIGKVSFFAVMSVLNDKDGDSTEVNFNHVIARKALSEQRVWIETELGKLDIEIS